MVTTISQRAQLSNWDTRSPFPSIFFCWPQWTPSFHTSRHYEVCKYYSLNEHTAVPDVLLVGTGSWKRFTEQEQQWIKEAAVESSIYQRQLWAASENESLKAIQEAGVEIIYPDKELFEQKTLTMSELFNEQPEILQLIDQIRNEK